MSTNIKFSQNMRLGGDNKRYWLAQLQQFANHFDPAQVRAVQFGKQDMRGSPSITLVDHRDCVPRQHHFKTNAELLAFVQGYNMAHSKFNVFKDFMSLAA